MVNEHSTVSNLKEYPENIDGIERVNAYSGDTVVFEAYMRDGADLTVQQVKQELPMLVDTYGATITEESHPQEGVYFRIELSGDGIIGA